MSYIAHVLVLVGVFALLALALNLLLGYAGLLHLGIAALFGVGAYLSAIFSLEGVPVYVTILIAVLLTGLISVLIGLPSLRVRGDFFVLVTLGFGFVQSIDPLMGFSAVLKGFTAAVLGGIGSVPGAVMGGYLIGLVENVGILFVPSGYKDALTFVVLIIVLLILPNGIFPKRVRM